MNRRRLAVLLGLVSIGGIVVLLRRLTPERYERLSSEVAALVSGLPNELILALTSLIVIAIWIAAMILLARVVYWGWRQIDDHVFRVWNLLLPESPLVRFAAGIMLMIGLFVLGPLVALQALELGADDDPINESMNESESDDVDNETSDTDDGANTANDRIVAVSSAVLVFAESAGPLDRPRISTG